MIHVVIGTKAQLIKMAPIMKLMRERNIDYNFISTGQHKDTIDEILADFDIKPPDFHLYTGRDITTIFRMLLWGLHNLVKTVTHRDRIFRGDRQGVVLVHGDTFSTLLGALMGRLSGLKVAHVESGLRSFRFFHPFPEEIIRTITFRLSDLMFCPDDAAMKNLNGCRGTKIDTGGNTLYDAVQLAVETSNRAGSVKIPREPFAIATIHRFENISTHRSLERIVKVIERIAQEYRLIFVLHKPTEQQLKKLGFFLRLKNNTNIELHPRYGYFDFVRLMSGAEFLVSDGGSNQEECHYMGKPVLLLRRATERHEGLGENALLSEYSMDRIERFLASLDDFRRPGKMLAASPSAKILDHCLLRAEWTAGRVGGVPA